MEKGEGDGQGEGSQLGLPHGELAEHGAEDGRSGEFPEGVSHKGREEADDPRSHEGRQGHPGKVHHHGADDPHGPDDLRLLGPFLNAHHFLGHGGAGKAEVGDVAAEEGDVGPRKAEDGVVGDGLHDVEGAEDGCHKPPCGECGREGRQDAVDHVEVDEGDEAQHAGQEHGADAEPDDRRGPYLVVLLLVDLFRCHFSHLSFPSRTWRRTCR
ncbi:hypothetical protein SDC9_44582 [bioreactor metagenome]|uniref:Uncharacterized protein n=1 Tax=bioreactor metagenome TaxID=1076179 RepID=A0A644W460_9ZZZZ